VPLALVNNYLIGPDDSSRTLLLEVLWRVIESIEDDVKCFVAD